MSTPAGLSGAFARRNVDPGFTAPVFAGLAPVNNPISFGTGVAFGSPAAGVDPFAIGMTAFKDMPLAGAAAGLAGTTAVAGGTFTQPTGTLGLGLLGGLGTAGTSASGRTQRPEQTMLGLAERILRGEFTPLGVQIVDGVAQVVMPLVFVEQEAKATLAFVRELVGIKFGIASFALSYDLVARAIKVMLSALDDVAAGQGNIQKSLAGREATSGIRSILGSLANLESQIFSRISQIVSSRTGVSITPAEIRTLLKRDPASGKAPGAQGGGSVGGQQATGGTDNANGQQDGNVVKAEPGSPLAGVSQKVKLGAARLVEKALRLVEESVQRPAEAFGKLYEALVYLDQAEALMVLVEGLGGDDSMIPAAGRPVTGKTIDDGIGGITVSLIKQLQVMVEALLEEAKQNQGRGLTVRNLDPNLVRQAKASIVPILSLPRVLVTPGAVTS